MSSSEGPIVNKIAASGLITLDLQTYQPTQAVATFDIKDYLFRGLILKEKDFRTALKELDWSQYANKAVAICCTASAIIPQWAYMLIATHLTPITTNFSYATPEELSAKLWIESLSKIDISEYEGKKMIVKGCADVDVPPAAFAEITRLLQPVVQSLMYGEACSTVPLYKKPRPKKA